MFLSRRRIKDTLRVDRDSKEDSTPSQLPFYTKGELMSEPSAAFDLIRFRSDRLLELETGLNAQEFKRVGEG